MDDWRSFGDEGYGQARDRLPLSPHNDLQVWRVPQSSVTRWKVHRCRLTDTIWANRPFRPPTLA